MTEDNEFNDTEKEFYKNVSKVASIVNDRLHGSIASGGLNETVEEAPEETVSNQIPLDQDDNYFPL
ncbi:hypothetical protein EHS13_18735 [Paenibacillus psychroresistens]|uniref:Uncharacterized protein n=1 Tax=Paenibacillus psychroresistens TaxID=1778678 RepID=A0A6B8RL52_9BACL|nr:hypothetical protein [Paenibacillus psychroresistens]QGQ96769.1 hypothetical protein EHS13_18735 [Paenibacillus psychroresistens]